MNLNVARLYELQKQRQRRTFTQTSKGSVPLQLGLPITEGYQLLSLVIPVNWDCKIVELCIVLEKRVDGTRDIRDVSQG